MIARLSFLIIFVSLSSPAWATDVEARCGELGSNCVCAEALGMTSFSVNSGSFHNPNDSITKQCGYEIANHPISRNDADLEASTDSTAIGRLPAGSSIARFMRAAPGNSGIFFLGADINTSALGSTYDARMAVRFYVYHSTDYNFIGDATPCHSKFLQGSVGSHHVENFQGYMHMYDFFGGNWGTSSGSFFPRDCCSDAPGSTYTMTKNDWRGHWFRVESVMTNRGTAGWRHIVYMQDVTNGVTKVNGGVEFVAVDTYSTDTGIDPWLATFNQQIISNPRQLPMVVNLYREDGAGDCQGWRGVSHFMVAGWSSDAGQRIGVATEFEGSGGGGFDPGPLGTKGFAPFVNIRR